MGTTILQYGNLKLRMYLQFFYSPCIMYIVRTNYKVTWQMFRKILPSCILLFWVLRVHQWTWNISQTQQMGGGPSQRMIKRPLKHTLAKRLKLLFWARLYIRMIVLLRKAYFYECSLQMVRYLFLYLWSVRFDLQMNTRYIKNWPTSLPSLQ
jgi:hypothetical protein